MTDKRKRVIAYVLACVGLLVGMHLWAYRHGEPSGGYVSVPPTSNDDPDADEPHHDQDDLRPREWPK